MQLANILRKSGGIFLWYLKVVLCGNQGAYIQVHENNPTLITA